MTGARSRGRVALAAARTRQRSVRRAGLVRALPVLAFGVVRPWLGSDALALAAAAAIPLVYDVVLVLWRRRIDLWALTSGLGFALGCLASVLAHGSALPLKLHQAAVSFTVGAVLLVAVLVRRPIPVGRFLRLPGVERSLDATLGAMIGGFLVLHALSTAAYLVTGRIVSWAGIAVGAGCLSGYLRHVRRQDLHDTVGPRGTAGPRET